MGKLSKGKKHTGKWTKSGQSANRQRANEQGAKSGKGKEGPGSGRSIQHCATVADLVTDQIGYANRGIGREFPARSKGVPGCSREFSSESLTGTPWTREFLIVKQSARNSEEAARKSAKGEWLYMEPVAAVPWRGAATAARPSSFSS